ncbi:MAG: hypothetical protein H5U40_16395, partial [Polyangiaceae bacterium]|nr:hypothetical protein [Polyangiaceae bacterium]
MKLHRSGDPQIRVLPGAMSYGPTSAELHVAARSERGEGRETNRDQFLVAELDRTIRVLTTSMESSLGRVLESPPGLLMAVADGLEEVRGGEVASAIAIDALVDHVASLVPWIGAAWTNTPDIVTGFRGALERCQERLREIA